MAQGTPFDELERLFARVERQLDDATPTLEGIGRGGIGAADAPIDVVETDEAIEVTAELPGFEPDDVDVRVADRTLFVDAEHSEDASVEEEDFVRRERSHRSISRGIPLPSQPLTDEASATMDNGILTVTIPIAARETTGESIDIA